MCTHFVRPVMFLHALWWTDTINIVRSWLIRRSKNNRNKNDFQRDTQYIMKTRIIISATLVTQYHANTPIKYDAMAFTVI
jgi:hypothetical protein